MKLNHTLKTDPECFAATVAGIKPFEIRKNDRDFKVGDELTLSETKYSAEEMKAGKPLEFTTHFAVMKVDYIMKGPIYGLAEGWVIMAGPITSKTR